MLKKSNMSISINPYWLLSHGTHKCSDSARLCSCAQTVPPNPPFSSLCTLVEIAGSTQELWDVFRPFFTLLWSQFKVHPPAKIKSYIRIELQTFALLLQNLLENRGHVSLSKHRLPLSYIHGHNVVGAWSLRARRREVSATESWSEALTSLFCSFKILLTFVITQIIKNPGLEHHLTQQSFTPYFLR